jgi:Mak10 subunit, NatC N(alpha)-terminal acetyltransferase
MSLRFEPQMPVPVPARSSRASRPSVVALDVTVRFNDAASALKTGQLVKQDDFTLFEAVSALEVRAGSVKLLAPLINLRGAGSENGPRFRRGFGG